MKIMIPVQSNNGLDSRLFAHFGRAPGYLFIDVNGDKISSMTFLERDENERGIDIIFKNKPDIVITYYIGSRAFYQLKNMGIKIYKADKFIVRDLINEYFNKKLRELLEPEEDPKELHIHER
jgi:predicted Fe-Mo cluster-binding NifX family protein